MTLATLIDMALNVTGTRAALMFEENRRRQAVPYFNFEDPLPWERASGSYERPDFADWLRLRYNGEWPRKKP